MAIVEEVIKMKVTVCIGSSCHLRGSQKIVERLQALIAEHQLQDKVDLAATFCTGHCQEGVCTTVDGELTVGKTKFVPMPTASDGLNIVILD